jgi:hypothetical protein
MRPNLFSLRSMMLAFPAAVVFTATAVACPDLSGTWAYPGVPGLEAICERQWEAQQDMPLPGPGGFYISAFEPHPFVIEQHGCETLVIHTRVGYVVSPPHQGPSEEKAITLDLRRSARRKVEWGEDSLFIRQKFVPEGFRLPISRNVWELRLKTVEGGGLEYHLRHLERGREEGEVRCRLAKGQIEP